MRRGGRRRPGCGRALAGGSSVESRPVDRCASSGSNTVVWRQLLCGKSRVIVAARAGAALRTVGNRSDSNAGQGRSGPHGARRLRLFSRGVRLEIMNVGTVGTGAFGVVSSAGPWWGIVDGLGPGETYEIFDPGSLLRSYRIDPYDVVRETDETNNEVPVAIPECVPPSPVPPDPGAGPVLLPWVGKRR